MLFLLPRRSQFLSAALLALTTPQIAAAQPAMPQVNGWGVALTDVTPDPAIRYGTLRNGMKYAVVRNAVPKGAAAVRLHLGFGSLMEAETERGLAHFIEHMAFNGTTHVPEGEMVKRLERLGLTFGPDTNASTGLDSTTYRLDLPVVDTERVDTALFLMREVASEVTFDPGAVDRERGVILGERRSREGFQLYQMIDHLRHVLPDAIHSHRLPIGTPQVIAAATSGTMRDLYRRYYRPENAVLVFVGDVDPAEIERKINAKFADWKGVGSAGVPPALGTVDFARPTNIDTFRNKNVPTSVNLTVLKAWDNPADTRAERRKRLLKSVGNSIFNRRLSRLVNQKQTPLLAATSRTEGWRNLARSELIAVAAKDGSWVPAVETAENELRKALTHGFSAAELRRELAMVKASFRIASAQANTRQSATIASAILSTVADREFVTHPAWRLSFYEAALPTLTLDAVNAAFRERWRGSAPQIHVSDKQPPTDAEIAVSWSAARSRVVAPPRDEVEQAFAYENFGRTGRLVADSRIQDMNIRTVRFANNVRLNIKRTDFEAGRVRFSVRVAGGQLTLPRDKPGLATMLSVLSSVSATARQSLEELKVALAGRVYSTGSRVGPDAFVAAGATTPDDLAVQMKVSAAYLTDPGYRPEAMQRWANMVPVVDKQFDSQPQTVFATRVPVALTGHDYRFGPPRREVLLQRNFDEVRPSLGALLATAPVEIGIVGDVDEEAVIAAVAQSFGALPVRSDKTPKYADERKASLRADMTPIVLFHTGPPDQAMVAAFWLTDDDDDYRREIGLAMLAKALNLTLSEAIREKLGASYGVNVRSAMSDVYDRFGTLSISTAIAPDKVDEVEAAMDAAVKAVVDRPVDDDLFHRVRAPMLESLAKSRRENGWWLGIVDQAQGRADRLERMRRQENLYRAITPGELHQLARAYLKPEAIRRVRILSNDTKTAGAATPVAKR